MNSGISVQNRRKAMIVLKLGLLALAGAFMGGCPVAEEPGKGLQLSLTEGQTERQYYLYKPAGYSPNGRYPLVVTLHALKPFDGAERQIKEWESTADKYGFMVVAPVVTNANMFALMLNKVDPAMKRDDQIIMNVVDEVLRETAADPDRVFITSFSAGGALMYYVTNQHPDRFAGLCARSCWFNPHILDEENARKMAADGFSVMIHYAEYDNTNIKMDSWKAVRWHEKMGFEVEFAVISQTVRLPGLGHMEGSDPHTAAEFFNRCVEEDKTQ